MLVSDVKLVTSSEYCELQAQVRCEPTVSKRPDISSWISEDGPFLLRYRFPAACESFLSPENGDPFVAALLAPAMFIGEPLRIPIPVSQKLMHSTDEIQSILQCWYRDFSKVVVEAPAREQALISAKRSSLIGLFFSLGVDSFYSLLKNVKNHPSDDETITHLLVVHGLDIYLEKWNSKLFPTVLANSGNVAQELGKEILPVTTNLREFTDRLVDWIAVHMGGGLASIALALGCMLNAVNIASGPAYNYLNPHGSHPLLDPLWSTEYLAVLHDGCEARRLDKVQFIAPFHIALENLRVCFNTVGEYNCGKCEKCLRTMICLHIAGDLHRASTFPQHIDHERLHKILEDFNERTPHKLLPLEAYWKDFVNALGASEEDLAIRKAIEECLSRNGVSVLDDRSIRLT